MPWFQNEISSWAACSTVLKNSEPLNERPEVLVNLSWRCSPGLNEDDFSRPPHWPHPVIMSPEGKVQWKWDRIKNHLHRTWHHENVSLYLLTFKELVTDPGLGRVHLAFSSPLWLAKVTRI